MTGNHDRWVTAIDEWLFIKNGYSVWYHVVPTGVAALLLVVLSLPRDNLLNQLVNVLSRPDPIWLAGALLAVISTGVYMATVLYQVRRAYLWPEHDLRRTLLTSGLYLLAISIIAALVLTRAHPLSAPAIWACGVIATLSLAGIGWSGPESWVDRVGVRCPDYLLARELAGRIQDRFSLLRDSPRGSEADLNWLVSRFQDLHAEVEKNAWKEPARVRQTVEGAAEALQIMQGALVGMQQRPGAALDLAAACRLQRRELYPDFTTALTDTARYWPKWIEASSAPGVPGGVIQPAFEGNL